MSLFGVFDFFLYWVLSFLLSEFLIFVIIRFFLSFRYLSFITVSVFLFVKIWRFQFLVRSQIKFTSVVTIWVLECCQNFCFWVWQNMSVWVLSQFKLCLQYIYTYIFFFALIFLYIKSYLLTKNWLVTIVTTATIVTTVTTVIPVITATIVFSSSFSSVPKKVCECCHHLSLWVLSQLGILSFVPKDCRYNV